MNESISSQAAKMEDQAVYHDGNVTFPAYMWEELCLLIGHKFNPHYLESK